MAEIIDFEPEPRLPRVRLIPFDEITLGQQSRYIVKGVIPSHGLVVVWGPPKSGKSFWTFDLVMHVALGWEYRGRRTKQGAVVYCAFEGQAGLETRVEAFRTRFLAEIIEDVIPFYLEPATLNLVADHAELIAVIRRQLKAPPAIVVLDTLNRSMAGSESNDEDMSAYIRAADAIREQLSCVVIVVHHCGIEGTRPRGHTSLTGAVDTQIAVKRDAADNITATVELNKDGPQGETITSKLEVVEVGHDEDGDIITSCVIEPAEGDALPGRLKVTGAAKTALDLLRKAIDEEGFEPPPGHHFTGAARVVKVATWRAYCDAGTIAESDKPDSLLKAFNRSSGKLQASGAIGVWAGHVWTMERRRAL